MIKTSAQEAYYKYARSKKETERRERRHSPAIAAVGGIPFFGPGLAGMYAGSVAPVGEGWATGLPPWLGGGVGQVVGGRVGGYPGLLLGGMAGTYGGHALARSSRE